MAFIKSQDLMPLLPLIHVSKPYFAAIVWKTPSAAAAAHWFCCLSPSFCNRALVSGDNRYTTIGFGGGPTHVDL